MNATARGLADLGLVPGDTIAVVMSNRRDLIEIYGAAVQTGLTFVAINWHLGETEIAYILDDSDARAVIVDGQFTDSARAAADRVSLPETSRFSADDTGGFRPLADLRAGYSGDALSDVAPARSCSTHRARRGDRRGCASNLPRRAPMPSNCGP